MLHKGNLNPGDRVHLQVYDNSMMHQGIGVCEDMIPLFNTTVTIRRAFYDLTYGTLFKIAEDNAFYNWEAKWIVDRGQNFRMLRPIV